MTHLGPHANGRGVVGTVSYIIQDDLENFQEQVVYSWLGRLHYEERTLRR